MRPRLYYGDIIYHKCDPEFKLDFTKKLESVRYSAALAVTGAWRTGFAKKLAGKSFIIESGIDACVTFPNCGMIRDRITYSEIPQERILLNRVSDVVKQSLQ